MKRLIIFTLLSALSLVAYSDDHAFQQYYRGNYAQSYPLLLELAQKNNAQALYLLANMKIYGYGGKKDRAKGLEYMTQAAEKNNLSAELYLGAYYLNEKKDLKQSLLWLEKAANQGNASAQLFAGLCYFNGFGINKNIDKAKKYFINAAKQNIPMAQFELGNLFLNSRHKTDKKMGQLWLSKAKKNNYSESNKTENASGDDLSKMMALLKNANVTIANPTRRIAFGTRQTAMPVFQTLSENQIIKPDYTVITPSNLPLNYIITQINKLAYEKQENDLSDDKAGNLLPKPTENEQSDLTSLNREVNYGHIQAMYELGLLYANGAGVDKNQEKAFTLFSKAANDNYLAAEYVVGLYYLNGWSVTKSIPDAMTWLQSAALHGSAKAQLLLGNIYEYGIKDDHTQKITEKDFSQAKAMYSLAAQNGVPTAQYRLAQLYASGLFNPDNNQTVEQDDLDMSLALYKKAADADISQAKIYLSYFYADKTKSKEQQAYAYKVATRYADDTNKNAQLLLAILYDRGIGVRQNQYKAREIYHSLANDNPVASFMLGTHYYLNNEQLTKAKEYLDKAAQAGNLFAQYNLAIIAKKEGQSDRDFITLLKKAAKGNLDQADLLLADHYLEKRDENNAAKEAALIYRQLAEKQNAIAELKLGLMYQKGIYFEKNIENAINWYQKSAEHGNTIAQYQLGEIYQFGIGVKRDLPLALTHYKKAAEQHFVPAMVAVGYIMQVDEFNYSAAKEWYQKSAELNSKEAKENLGILNKWFYKNGA